MGLITIILAILLVAGSIGGFILGKKLNTQELTEDEAIKKASTKASTIISEAEEKALEKQEALQEKAKKVREKLDEQEDQLLKREKTLNQRRESLNSREEQITTYEEEIKLQKKNIKDLRERLQDELENIASLTREEAKEKLLEEVEESMKGIIAKKTKRAIKKAEGEADEKAKQVLIDAMQSASTDYVKETTTSVIKLDDKDMKGRIIGKNGRNIRSFENLTGVDLVIDESPEAIAISCFDPVRRELAKLAMNQLLEDGRIHPGYIEKTVKEVKKKLYQEIMRKGKKYAQEVELYDLPKDVIKLIGKMKYRTSYGQSLLRHTMEVVNLSEFLAHELGADVQMTKQAALLHDVGKVLSHKISKPHHHISGDVIRKYKLGEKLANAAEAHHDDIEPKSIEAVIVHMADAISGARPGARQESYENFVKRVKALEDIAKKVGKKKVDEVYAIHAGREVRVIVKPEKISDDECVVLSQKVANKIEETQTYPGTIQVTVIRETRAIDRAK